MRELRLAPKHALHDTSLLQEVMSYIFRLSYLLTLVYHLMCLLNKESIWHGLSYNYMMHLCLGGTKTTVTCEASVLKLQVQIGMRKWKIEMGNDRRAQQWTPYDKWIDPGNRLQHVLNTLAFL